MKNRNYPLYELQEYKTINEMVIDKARTLSNETAFQYMQKKNIVNITYQQFLTDILKLGNFLNEEYGVNKHIAILGENSYLWLVVFMASIMSGNVAVLLDKELGALEIGNLLAQSHSDVCVYSNSYCDIAEELVQRISDVDFISMKTVFEKIEEESGSVEIGIQENAIHNVVRRKQADKDIMARWERQCDKDKLAAIFFTSGTSGQSKGVMLSQSNMMSDINMACKNFSVEGNVLAVLPFHHAFGLLSAVLKIFNYGQTIFINSSLKTIKRDMIYAKPQTMLLVPLFVETFYKSIW